MSAKRAPKHDNDDIVSIVPDWNGYYKGIFGVEKPLFMDVTGDYFEKYYDVVDQLAGNKKLFKEFIEDSAMNNCVLLPSKAADGTFKLNLMHSTFPEDDSIEEWAPYKTMLIGTDDIEFNSTWKRFDPWMAWTRQSYLNDAIHPNFSLRIPLFGEFLNVKSADEFSTLQGRHEECTWGFQEIEKIPNGFILFPTWIKLFEIESGMDCNMLGFKVVSYVNKVLEQRKKNNDVNEPVPDRAYEYIYKFLVWAWSVGQGYAFDVKVTDIDPMNQVQATRSTNHLIGAVRVARKFAKVPEYRIGLLVPPTYSILAPKPKKEESKEKQTDVKSKKKRDNESPDEKSDGNKKAKSGHLLFWED